MVAFAGQGVVLVFFVAIYIAYLSLLAFALSVAILCVAGVIFHARIVRSPRERARRPVGQSAVRSSDGPSGRLQEVRLNRSRSDDLFDDIVEVSRTAANIKIRTQSESYKQLVFSQSTMYLLLATVVFVVPAFTETKGSILQVTTALMFVVGVCMGIVQTIPILQAANVAADNIERLELRLRAIAAAPTQPLSCRDSVSRKSRCAMSCSVTSTHRRRPSSGWDLSISPAVRGAGVHYRRQRVGHRHS
jgi:putative ATP-binding cassette transporter